MVQIPLIAIANQEFQIILEEQECTIHLYQLGDYFYLDLYVGDDTIIEGAIVQPRCGIIPSPTNFKGQLYIVDEQNTPAQPDLPNLEELGTRFNLYYLTEDEVSDFGLRY